MLRLLRQFAAFAVFASSIASAAAAQGQGWDLANRAYLAGAQDPVTPETKGEMLTCGAYWTVWRLTLQGSGFSEEELAGLAPQLRQDSADVVAQAYVPDFAGTEEAEGPEFDGYLQEASALFDAYLGGNEEAGGTFFSMLGLCHPRAAGGAQAPAAEE